MLAVTFLILCATLYISEAATGDNVTLTVVHSEVDSPCNENVIVMLSCEVTGQSQLRWQYTRSTPSHNDTIISFLSDSQPQNTPMTISNKNPAFLTVQLLNVTRSITTSELANFSSVLSVNLFELENQNVTKITCGGDVATFNKGKLVADMVILPNVTAIYQHGTLTNIGVQLRNLFLCFPSVLLYTVHATGSAEVERVYNDCTGPFCEVQFSSITHTEEQFTRLSVVALTNKSRIIETTVSIEQRSDRYFLPEVNSSSDCSYSPHCGKLAQDQQLASTCTVEYTSSLPTSTAQQLALDSTVQQQSPGTVHTFNFSLKVSDLLYITEIISTTDVPSLELYEIVVVLITCLFLLMTLVQFSVLLLIKACCKMKMLAYEKKALVVSTFTQILLLQVCISLLIAFGIIRNLTACSDVEASSRDSVLDTMIVAASLGTASLLAIWTYLGYKVYKHYKSASVCPTVEDRVRNSNHGNRAEPYSTMQRESNYYNPELTIVRGPFVQDPTYAVLMLQRHRTLTSSCTVSNYHYKTSSAIF